MDKKIGNLFLIVSFLSSIIVAKPAIKIEMMNNDHQLIKEAQIGVPFILQITCQNFKPKSGLQGVESKPNVSINFAGSSQIMNYMNGTSLKEEYIFQYMVNIKQKGNFQFGPIVAQDEDDTTITSEKINIVVGDIVQPKHTGHEQYILDLDCPLEQVYIGQKLKIYLNFCYQANFQDLTIENTLLEDVEMGYQDKNWKSTKTIIASQEYPCKQMSMEIFPKKIGTLIIPSFRATFIAEQSRDIGLFGFFGFSNSKTIQSHPKSIKVVSLPESQEFGNVQAIGKFESATFKIEQSKGQIGEGIHAKMIIRGDGNLEILHHPELILPEGINFYEGNSSFEHSDDYVSKKTFDWILQADSPGIFEIKFQSFTYFDPTDKKYKQIQTNSQELIIESGKQTVDKIQENNVQALGNAQEQENDKISTPKAQEKSITYYSAEKFYNTKTSHMLTWWIIFFIIILIIFFIAIMLLPYLNKIFFIQTLQYRWLFWRFYRSGNITAIYQLFEKLSIDYGFGLQSPELNQCFLEHNLSAEAFENWKNFLNVLLEFNFAYNKTVQDKQLVLDLAKQWFSIILLCCKTLRKT